MTSRTTTRLGALILAALTATVGFGLGEAAGVDRGTFTGRPTQTATIGRTPLNQRTPYQAPTTVPSAVRIASQDLAFADHVCVTGQAELAQQHCEEQCWAAGDDCRISCASDCERFLGLKEFDPLERACWEIYWEGCFVDRPEVPEDEGGGVPAPFYAPTFELETRPMPTGPISPPDRGKSSPRVQDVVRTTDTRVQLDEPTKQPLSVRSRLGVPATPTTRTHLRR